MTSKLAQTNGNLLIQYINDENIGRSLELLKQKEIDLSVVDEDGYTPLLSACNNNNIEIADKILDDPNCFPDICDFEGFTPLLLSIKNNCDYITNKILDKYPNNCGINIITRFSEHVIMYALSKKKFKIALKMLDIGLTKMGIQSTSEKSLGKTSFMFAVDSKQYAIVDKFIELDHVAQDVIHTPTKKTILQFCLSHKYEEEMESIVLKIIDKYKDDIDLNNVDIDGNTALYLSIHNGYKKIILKLLENNSIKKSINEKCLRDAIYKEMKDIAELFLPYLSDVELTPDILRVALDSGLEDIAIKLIQRDPDENYISHIDTNFDRTMLMISIGYKYEKCSLLLLDNKNIDISHVSKIFKTTLQHACVTSQDNIKETIMKIYETNIQKISMEAILADFSYFITNKNIKMIKWLYNVTKNKINKNNYKKILETLKYHNIDKNYVFDVTFNDDVCTIS